MGREIKRVPLDFNWPINKIWEGFLNPHWIHRRDCPFCEGSGSNPETKQIYDDWYDFAETGRRWCNNITQHEVDALIEKGRLMDFTHSWTKENGWQKKDPLPVITAEQVNEWSKSGIGHDSINCWICVRARAEKLGVYGRCVHCDGEGDKWRTIKDKEAYEAWESYEPPVGEGWQVWETVSEGSPISPVFKTKGDLVQWLVGQGYSEGAAVGFADTGWAMSAVMCGGKYHKDIEACEPGICSTQGDG